MIANAIPFADTIPYIPQRITYGVVLLSCIICLTTRRELAVLFIIRIIYCILYNTYYVLSNPGVTSQSVVRSSSGPRYELTIQRPASCNGHAQLQALLNTEDYSCAVCTGAGTWYRSRYRYRHRTNTGRYTPSHQTGTDPHTTVIRLLQSTQHSRL